jgi:hypothetical protein
MVNQRRQGENRSFTEQKSSELIALQLVFPDETSPILRFVEIQPTSARGLVTAQYLKLSVS